MSHGACFVAQTATRDILLRVTNVCGECYGDLNEGDTIYYDMQQYRYLCECCKEKLCAVMDEQTCEIIDENRQDSLFC